MILLLVMALAALPSVGAAASRSLGCPAKPMTEAVAQEVIDFWERQNAAEQLEPTPSFVSDGDRYSDSKAGTIPPIGIEIVSSPGCPAVR
ncbi:hypothetical protein OG339_09830 [Streptosporangium sp. NBC_01495]|uniref:hypothetical protein n=1 Tax=Streptosporangium sp. NBC_01495 TaxID=2903899 RepID=UPI002E34436B|nr:hypothetical protein [Streptosporangium sp. NBC_01495]